MSRRMMPTLVVIGLGFALLLWGLGSLQRILIAERDESHARVRAEQNALQEYARRTVEQRLEGLLHETEIDWARNDPLMPTQHLMLIEHGEAIFPRPIRYAHTPPGLVRELYDALREGRPVDAEPGSPWARRLDLARDLRRAVLEGDRPGIERRFRDIIAHQTYWKIDSRREIPLSLATLELLIDFSKPHPDLIASVLLRGVYLGEQRILEGLQPSMIRRRERFSAEDFQFLSGRIIALSKRTQTPFEDFQARIAEPPTVRLAAPPGMLNTPSLVLGGSWYARPDGSDRVIGAIISLDDVLRSVESEMRARALLEPGDSLVRPVLRDDVVPLRSLAVGVHSPRFARAIADGDRRFWVKTGFVGLSAGLALVIVALALVLQSRRHRFVELKSDFVATVSHELRTPLASIRLMAETLERRTSGIPSARDYPTRIVREIDDLGFLVENILSFNRLDKNRWKPRKTPVDLADLVDDIRRELPSFAPRRVEWHTEGLDVTLDADPELLRLLLRNLAKNACTYSERDPIRISWHGRKGASTWSLQVRDNGVGISASERRRIFADFYRAPSNASRGSGLGLAICRRVMQAHGGQIGVQDSSEQGTTFVLHFPGRTVMPPLS